jgi:hypothetical protein
MKTQYIKINEYGTKHYYSDAAMKILHRLDGPAIELADGSKLWCVDGKRHRLDGPAVDWSNGDKLWYVDGKCLFEEDINRLTAKEIVLTMDEIAAKFGISVEQLKITK